MVQVKNKKRGTMSGRHIYACTIASGGALPFYTGFNRSIPAPIRNESTQYQIPALPCPTTGKQGKINKPIARVVMRLCEIVAHSRMRSALHICPVNEGSTATNMSIQ